MLYIDFGTGKMPALGLGTWKLAGKGCVDSVKKALAMGYTHIDTAEAYGNESEIGMAIKGFDREKLFITSKVWTSNYHYDDVLAACQKSLERLNTGYLDMYLLHWPSKEVPLSETLNAMNKLVRDVNVRHIGVSNFSIGQLEEARKLSEEPIITNQVECHPCFKQQKLSEYCKANSLFITAYSPLGRGEIFRNKVITGIAEKNNRSPAQVCLRWLLQKGMAVIPKASSDEHLKDNISALEWELNAKDAEKIDSIDEHKRIVNPDFAEWDD